MNIKLLPRLIFRTPRFSLQDGLKEIWPHLKLMIRESSKDFFSIIKEVTADQIPAQPLNVQHTIWKYFNRAQNRSTPFGTFAAVGVCDVSPDKSEIIIDPEPTVHRFNDWRMTKEGDYQFDDLIAGNEMIFTNSLHYFIKDSVRFVSLANGEFTIVETIAEYPVRRILELCARPIPINSLKAHLTDLSFSDAGSDELIEQLIDIRLLLTSLDPNITGEDHFSRLNIPAGPDTDKYIISERTVDRGGFTQKKLTHLSSLIGLLPKLTEQEEHPRLQRFINLFRKRFDMEEVPIMIALDPEVGVGYNDMETAAEQDDLIQRLASQRMKKNERPDPLRTHLLKSIGSAKVADGSHIQLEDIIDLNSLKKQDSLPLPNSLSVLFTECGENIFIEHIGGISATALMGRFTLASGPILSIAKEAAAIEQASNPEVLFFDLAYTAEAEVDNVNRRRHIYDHQLSMFSFETSEQFINADDILISLQGNSIILRSKRLNKRIVPRCASAYNHTRSDLPIFRLLCDLQSQGLASRLKIDIESVLPDSAFYPRIKFKNIILSAAKWRIAYNEHTCKDLQSFRSFLNNKGILPAVRCGIGDQVLYFDTKRDMDLDMLLYYLRQKKELLIEESFVPMDSCVKDEHARPYAAQFMATFFHEGTLYTDVNTAGREVHGGQQKTFLPGTEWLYFEIFCHTAQADQLLTGPIAKFLTANDTLIKKWFFIRYDEDGAHLRLRIHLNDRRDHHIVSDSLMAHLDEEWSTGVISDIRIKVYRRELERYGADTIEQAEKQFYIDSRYILLILQERLKQQQLYYWCIEIAQGIIEASIEGISDLAQLGHTVLHALEKEHKLGPSDFTAINKNCKMLSQQYTHGNGHSPYVKEVVNSFIEVLSQAPVQSRRKMFIDLFHMHVNRLFPSHQRTHEMMIYSLLKRMEQVKKHKRQLSGLSAV